MIRNGDRQATGLAEDWQVVSALDGRRCLKSHALIAGDNLVYQAQKDWPSLLGLA